MVLNSSTFSVEQNNLYMKIINYSFSVFLFKTFTKAHI